MSTTSIFSFEEQTRKRIASGDLDGALRVISSLVDDVISDQRSIGIVFSSHILDQLCIEIGKKNHENWTTSGSSNANNAKESQAVRLYIVTELAATGGHSRVLWDLLQADKHARHIVLVTDLGNKMDIAPVKQFLSRAGGTVIVAPHGSYIEKLSWLQRNIKETGPGKIFLLLHHFDSVSVAAIQADIADKTVFIHNADHSLSLGVHLNCIHIDYHAKGYYNCKEILGVANNRYWPLTAEDFGEKSNRTFLATGNLTTATSGGFEKFETPHLRKSIPYAFSYANLIPKVLLVTGGKHIHIGNLSEDMLTSIRRGLNDNYIDPERFVHVKYVTSIWKSMHNFDIDMYIDSFPLGGGKAIIEVMGSGTPLIAHANYRSPFLCDEPEVYKEAFRWMRPAELFEVLRNATVDTLVAQSKFARSHYMANNHPDLLTKAVSELEINRGKLREPPRPMVRVDPLQTFLDFRRVDEKEKPAASKPDPTHIEMISQLEAEKNSILDELSKKMDYLSEKITHLEIENITASNAARQRIAQLEGQNTALLNSTSWRISAPVRVVKRLLSRKNRG